MAKGFVLTNDDDTADLSAGVSMSRVEVNDSDYNATKNDHTIVFTELTQNRVVNLPSASLLLKGNTKVIKNASGSARKITINPDGSDTIEDSSSAEFSGTRDAINIECDGVSKWIVY